VRFGSEHGSAVQERLRDRQIHKVFAAVTGASQIAATEFASRSRFIGRHPQGTSSFPSLPLRDLRDIGRAPARSQGARFLGNSRRGHQIGA
jgi:hypothetical protein